MTTQTTPPDDCIAEALRLAGSPPISIAILREHHQSAVYSTIWHLAATIHKLQEAEASFYEERVKYEERVLEAEMNAIATNRKLVVAVEALTSMRDDLLMRAEIDDGEKVVACGAGVWFRLNKALAQIKEANS